VFTLLPPDNATGNFTKVVQRIPVKITLDGSANALVELRPGMSVIPTIETHAQVAQRRAAATSSPAIASPTSAKLSGAVCHVKFRPDRFDVRDI
jgi:membrane fusion protein (multidrug efflux system)